MSRLAAFARVMGDLLDPPHVVAARYWAEIERMNAEAKASLNLPTLETEETTK